MHTTSTHFEAPLSKLVPSPLNPRKTLGDLKELTESIKAKGILQSLLVRPAPIQGEGKLEIVCGERRWRAAQKAGVTAVPVVLRELDDESALEAMVVENSQRADVSPLEESDGIAALRDRGRSAEDIAAKLGRSPAFVHRRLVLQQLGKNARKALVDERLSVGAAEQLATVPGALQDEALKRMLPYQHATCTTAGARDIVGREFRLELAGAPFALDAAELVPKAGACTNCPKRTGAQPALFEGETKDRCTDPACFTEKKTAVAAKHIEQAKGIGRTVLSQAEAKGIWPSAWSTRTEGPYVDLDEKSGQFGDGKKWRAVLGAKRLPEEIVVAVNPHTGVVHELVKRTDLKRALADDPKKTDPEIRPPRYRASGGGLSAADKRAQAIAKAKREGHKRAAAELREKLETKGALKGKLAELLELVGFGIVEHFFYEEIFERIAKRRGWTQDKKEEPRECVERELVGRTAEQTAALIVELLVERSFAGQFSVDGFAAKVMDFVGVDWLEHEKTAIAEVEEKLAAKKTTKKKSAKKKASKRKTVTA